LCKNMIDYITYFNYFNYVSARLRQYTLTTNPAMADPEPTSARRKGRKFSNR
jgi:hypothetical protein